MTLEKHVIDTIKECQIKIGSLESGIGLYYPKASVCDYLHLEDDTDNDILCKSIKESIHENADFLGDISVSVNQDRFCIRVGASGCDYIEKNIPASDFLVGFLEILKNQNMSEIQSYFEEYAGAHWTRVCVEKEDDGMGTVLFIEDDNVEPYVYCFDENEFGITYHRFTRGEYKKLH